MKSTVVLSLLASLVSAQIFAATTFNEISIAGGVAGNGQQEALDVLALPEDLTTVEQADLDFLKAVNSVCNDAEVDAFNTAIDAAGGKESEEGAAIQRGKIKNKILKLTATVLRLQAEEAQGNGDAAKLEKEQAKLANNIKQDEDEAGNESVDPGFEGEVSA